MPFGRVFQHISLIDFDDVYRQFTCVSHTIEASLPSAFVLADMTDFTIRLSGYFVPEASHRRITLAARPGRLLLAEQQVRAIIKFPNSLTVIQNDLQVAPVKKSIAAKDSQWERMKSFHVVLFLTFRSGSKPRRTSTRPIVVRLTLYPRIFIWPSIR